MTLLSEPLTIGANEGSFKSKFTRVRIFLHGYANEKLNPTLNGTKIDLFHSDYRFVAPVTDFDPWHYATDKSKVIDDLQYVKADFVNEEVVVKW